MRAKFKLEYLPADEHVFNQVQGQIGWSTIELSIEQKRNIKLALTVEEESRE